MKNASFHNWFETISQTSLSPHDFFYQFIEFLNQHDFHIKRVTLGSRPLHPEVEAQVFSYLHQDFSGEPARNINPALLRKKEYIYENAQIQHVLFGLGVEVDKGFKNSPIPIALKTQKSIRIQIWNNNENPFPIIGDLRKANMTEYFLLPLPHEGKMIAFMSFASSRPQGLSDEQVEELTRMCIYFSMKWASFQQKEIIESLLSLYLGSETGKNVLNGNIKRGNLESLEAIIWFSDIRGYTHLSSHYPSAQVIQWLNEYYEEQISIIHGFGGEVLKLLGDGILAVFPTTKERKILTTARRAVIASIRSLEKIKISNRSKKEQGIPEIQHGIALHRGNVKYGNIGSKDRLDFTIIGHDVNLTARICSLCSSYQKDIILSEQISKLLPGQVKLLAEKVQLKGISKNHKIFVIEKPS
ncbi:MAG: adenylate/guanylate cyclase domain-containing protein [Spirochaetota bacterium]